MSTDERTDCRLQQCAMIAYTELLRQGPVKRVHHTPDTGLDMIAAHERRKGLDLWEEDLSCEKNPRGAGAA